MEDEKIKLFRSDFNSEKEYEDAIYRITREIGDKRFGTKCRHLRIRNGYCLNCFRKVVDKF